MILYFRRAGTAVARVVDPAHVPRIGEAVWISNVSYPLKVINVVWNHVGHGSLDEVFVDLAHRDEVGG